VVPQSDQGPETAILKAVERARLFVRSALHPGQRLCTDYGTLGRGEAHG